MYNKLVRTQGKNHAQIQHNIHPNCPSGGLASFILDTGEALPPTDRAIHGAILT